MTIIALSGPLQIGLTLAAGLFAIVLGGVGIYHTLGSEDQASFRTLARHPLRTIFTEDEPDPED